MPQVLGAVAQHEKAMIVAKLRGTRERVKRRRDAVEGRKPFGYFAGEAETIQRIRELRSEGLGFDRIAERLNAEGSKGRSGGRWLGLVVNRILSRKAGTR
jgi:DNA invertase Pin-like site-specific DNA recombinase